MLTRCVPFHYYWPRLFPAFLERNRTIHLPLTSVRLKSRKACVFPFIFLSCLSSYFLSCFPCLPDVRVDNGGTLGWEREAMGKKAHWWKIEGGGLYIYFFFTLIFRHFLWISEFNIYLFFIRELFQSYLLFHLSFYQLSLFKYASQRGIIHRHRISYKSRPTLTFLDFLSVLFIATSSTCILLSLFTLHS